MGPVAGDRSSRSGPAELDVLEHEGRGAQARVRVGVVADEGELGEQGGEVAGDVHLADGGADLAALDLMAAEAEREVAGGRVAVAAEPRGDVDALVHVGDERGERL